MELYTTTLWRTATVVWKRCYVDNLSYLNSRSIDGTNGTLTAITRTLDKSLYLTETKLEGNLCAVLSSHLGCIRSVLLGTTESHLTSRRPRDNLTLAVCQRYNDIVERAVNVQLTYSVNSYISFLIRCCCFLCHN